MTLQPTLRQQRLAGALLRLREDAGLTKEDVRKAVDIAPSTLWRYENAKGHAPRPRKLAGLLDLYGVEEPRRSQILTLARDAENGHGWWEPYAADLYPELVSLIAMEAEAPAVQTWELARIPGLLQTPDYARALIHGELPMTGHEVEQRVKVRAERQAVFDRDEPLRLWAILDESALLRQVGSPAVMAAQLQHLLRACAEPHVTLQVVPHAAGAHAGMDGPFVILDMADAEPPGVVYLEGLGGGLFLEDTADVSRFREVFDRLRAVALSPADSLAMVTTIAEGTK